VKIVKRSDQAKGFVVLPRRWVVEGNFGLASLGRCRRLAKGWEIFNRKALAFLRFASVRLMLRKLCNPACSLRTDSELNSLGKCRGGIAPPSESAVDRAHECECIDVRERDP
jgi:hypothetical protein